MDVAAELKALTEARPGPTAPARATAHLLGLSARPLLARWPMTPRWLRAAGLVDRLAPLALPAPSWAEIERLRIGDVEAEWVRAPNVADDRVVLYFHGGGFLTCGLRTHRRLIARISAAAGAPVLSVAYRQLPVAPLTTSVTDCAQAYRWLLEQGHSPENVVVAGDSAGGFLAFAATLRALEEDLPAPAGIVALAPLTDLDHRPKAAHENARHETYLPGRKLKRLALLLTEGMAPLDPALSPVNADLRGLPPVLIQVGSTELLRPDSELMAERLTAAGVPCTLQVWGGQVHVFQMFADLVPEGKEAIGEIGAFVREQTKPRTRRRARPRRAA